MTFFARFDIEGVKKIYEHSIKHPVFEPTLTQMFSGEYRKDGKDFVGGKGQWPTADDVDVSKLTGHFLLVKDAGSYLMAGTKERLPGKDDAEKGQSGYNFVVYCEGCNPHVDDDYWSLQQSAFGGDDFGEALPLEWLKIAIDNAERTGIDVMIIKVTEGGFQLMTDWE